MIIHVLVLKNIKGDNYCAGPGVSILTWLTVLIFLLQLIRNIGTS